MAAKVPVSFTPAGVIATNPLTAGLAQYIGYLITALSGLFGLFAVRLNQALVEDGTEAMTAPLPLKVYTAATRPATGTIGAVIYVSDAASGSRLQAWNGSAWVSGG